MFEEDCDAINNINGYDDLGAIYENGYQDLYCSAELQALFSPTDVRGGLLLYGSDEERSAGLGGEQISEFATIGPGQSQGHPDCRSIPDRSGGM